jgi:hypothetical protein
MRVNLGEKGLIKPDKNCNIDSEFFVGTVIQSMGDLKGYSVQMMFVGGMSIPSVVKQTFTEAKDLEDYIWKVMK